MQIILKISRAQKHNKSTLDIKFQHRMISSSSSIGASDLPVFARTVMYSVYGDLLLRQKQHTAHSTQHTDNVTSLHIWQQGRHFIIQPYESQWPTSLPSLIASDACISLCTFSNWLLVHKMFFVEMKRIYMSLCPSVGRQQGPTTCHHVDTPFRPRHLCRHSDILYSTRHTDPTWRGMGW